MDIESFRASIVRGESQFREFKSALQGLPGLKVKRPAVDVRRDICETLVAFANADGGELFVGIEDDGTITGIPHSESDVSSFVEAYKHGVHKDTPLAPPRVSRVVVDGKLVLVLAVAKDVTQIVVTSSGRCLQRQDRESVPVSFSRITFERGEHVSRAYDRQYVDGAAVDALDLEAISAAGQEIAPGLSPEKLLQLLELADFDGVHVRLRRAALLLFSKEMQRWHPRCQVRVIRVMGTTLETGRDYNALSDVVVAGNVLALLVKAWEAVRPHLVQTRLEASGLFEERIVYPEAACREALTNAIAHRDYSDEGKGIEVYVYNDRLEVRSPGSLLSTVTIEDLRALQGAHESRNPFVARVLREVGYMRELGEGVRRIFKLMKDNDLVEPELKSGSSMFSIVLHHESIFSEKDQRWLSAFEAFNLTPEEMKVVLLGRDGQLFSTQQVFDLLEIKDTEYWRALLEGLQLKGLVETAVPRGNKGGGANKRKVPRFRIRDPKECQKSIGELLARLNGRRSLTPIESRDLASSLASDNVFKGLAGREPLNRSLRRLGLID